MSLSYQTATLYGDSLTDYVWVKNTVDSQATINNTLANTYAPTWDATTELLAPFTSNINGGNTQSISDDIINWWIYKKTPNDLTLKLVAIVPVSQNNVIDYNVFNNTEYQYTIFAETSNYLSAPLQSNGYTTTNWWNWSLVGMNTSDRSGTYYGDSSNVWLFDTNLSSEEMPQNLAVYTYENFTQFPKVAQGLRNYVSGKITCYLGNYNSANKAYSDTVSMQNAFRTFVNNGKPKLLRDRKGNGYIVQTTDSGMSTIDNSSEQILQLTFSFTQIDDCSNVRVIGGI